jgi:hypothetical protein
MDASFTAEDEEDLEQELQQLTAHQIADALPAVPSDEIEITTAEPVAVPKESPARNKQSVPKRQALEAT